MISHRKRRFVLIIGLAISAIFLWLAVRDTDLGEIRSAFDHANWSFAPAVLLLLCVYFVVKTIRWKYLLLPIANVTVVSLIPVVVVGYASNLLLPAQMGELVRTFLAGNKYKVAASPVLVTIVIERMFDFLTILIFVGLILSLTKEVPQELILAGYICGAIGFAMVIAVITHILRPRIFTRLFVMLLSVFPRTFRQHCLRQFELATNGLDSLRQPRIFLVVSASSLVQWLLMGMCMYFSILAVGLDLPVSAAYVVLAVVVVGMTIPSSPGFFGTIQLCFTIGLAPFGVETGTAIAASIVFHGILVVATAVGGAVFVRYLGYSPKDLLHDANPT